MLIILALPPVVKLFKLGIAVMPGRARMLPQEKRGRVVGSGSESVWEEQSVAGQTPVVVSHECRCGGEDDGYGGQNFCAALMPRRFSYEPPERPSRYRNTEQQAFVGAAVGQDGDSQSESDSVTESGAARNALEGTEHQSRRDGCGGSSPVAIHPIAGDTEFRGRQQATERRPTSGHPRLQHPHDRGAHGSHTQQDAEPWVSEKLAHGEDQSLCRRINRGIGREPIDVKGVEARPHRVWRVGEPTVRKGVAHKEVTVLVMNSGNRDGKQWQYGDSGGDYTDE